MDFLVELNFWHWLILGVVLLFLEVMLPVTFFLWVAVAAGITGCIVYFIPDMSWQTQYIVFAAFSVVSVVLSRIYYNKKPIETDQPDLNNRMHSYIGRTVELSSPIVNGIGRVKLEDSTWLVKGTSAVLGSKVKIVGAEGPVLIVELLQ